MCGIAGIVKSREREISLQRIERMTAAIAHRGPDGDGHWMNTEGSVVLGHRRLSIIDLSHAGDQPMHYLDRYTIVFNGEIYNYIELKEDLEKKGYRFVSNSDTEVLLAMYDHQKEQCLQYLDGMFAFVIYDQKEQQLFCARDRFGEKPFYYHVDNQGSFLFASEMKALWAVGVSREYEPAMLYNFLSSDMVSNPEDPSATFYKGIKKLPNASYLLLQVTTLQFKVNPYWSLNPRHQRTDISEDQALATFTSLFYDSVTKRLRSDVPVGSSLSGGIDSSVVVCVINELHKQRGSHSGFNTFSAQFPGFTKDESYYQGLVIERTGVKPHFIYPDEHSLQRNFEMLMYHQEEPFSTLSISAQYEVYAKAREEQIPVLLDGQGADELLGGYPFYYYSFLNEQHSKSKRKYQTALQSIQTTYGTLNPDYLPERLVNRLKLLLPQPLVKTLKKKGKVKESTLVSSAFGHAFAPTKFYGKTEFSNLNEALFNSLMVYGMQDLLRYADRNAMAHAVEVRLPFLSHKLVEYVFSLPATLKIKDGFTKWILRKSMEPLVPPQITWRSDKIGYETPYISQATSTWYRDMVRESIDQLKKQKIISASFEPGAQEASDKNLLKIALVANMGCL